MLQNNGKLMPNLNLDQQSTKVLNLTVLQRIDPYVEEILITAAHVTFYEFNIDLNQWSRKDVEGSLFVVKRNTQPRFQFIVMNRRNAENLVEDILGDFEYEIQTPYLLYRNASQEVNGIWFYNQQDCEAVANLFSRITHAFAKVPPKTKLSSSKSSDFEELEAVPNLAVMDGPLEPPTSSTTSIPDVHVPDDSFVNFFSAAMSVGNASNATVVGPPHQPSNIPSASHSVNVIPSAVTPFQPSSLPTLPNPLIPNESSGNNNRSTNLINPSLFTPPPASPAFSMPLKTESSMPTAPPLQPPVTMQRPYGAPLLQPFPPPAPSLSLTPTPSPNYGPVISREKVREALLRLVQDDLFVDLVYREMMNAHYPQ